MPTDRLRHAGHGDFLYRRGSVFYFRRSVPPALREAFGKGEVVASLGTANLAEARHLLADHVRAFDTKAAKAGGGRDPTPPKPVAATPDRDQMNAAVRAWLAEMIQRSDPMVTGNVPSNDEVSSLSGQHRQSATHLQSSAVFGSQAGLATEWIAQSVAEREGWALDHQSPEYRYLFNVVHAGQLEVASQVPELIGLRPVTVRNAALFGPGLLAADKTRPRGSPALSDCLERYLVNPSLKANEKTRKQYRQRLTVLVEAFGPSPRVRQDTAHRRQALALEPKH